MDRIGRRGESSTGARQGETERHSERMEMDTSGVERVDRQIRNDFGDYQPLTNLSPAQQVSPANRCNANASGV